MREDTFEDADRWRDRGTYSWNRTYKSASDDSEDKVTQHRRIERAAAMREDDDGYKVSALQAVVQEAEADAINNGDPWDFPECLDCDTSLVHPMEQLEGLCFTCQYWRDRD